MNDDKKIENYLNNSKPVRIITYGNPAYGFTIIFDNGDKIDLEPGDPYGAPQIVFDLKINHDTYKEK